MRPVTGKLPTFGIVTHRGRNRGRRYHTPINVFQRGDTYLALNLTGWRGNGTPRVWGTPTFFRAACCVGRSCAVKVAAIVRRYHVAEELIDRVLLLSELDAKRAYRLS